MLRFSGDDAIYFNEGEIAVGNGVMGGENLKRQAESRETGEEVTYFHLEVVLNLEMASATALSSPTLPGKMT